MPTDKNLKINLAFFSSEAKILSVQTSPKEKTLRAKKYKEGE